EIRKPGGPRERARHGHRSRTEERDAAADQECLAWLFLVIAYGLALDEQLSQRELVVLIVARERDVAAARPMHAHELGEIDVGDEVDEAQQHFVLAGVDLPERSCIAERHRLLEEAELEVFRLRHE